MVETTALTTKQKVIGVLTVVIFAFIIYEVIGLFSSGKSTAPVITPAKPAVSSAQQKQTQGALPATQRTPSSQQPVLATVSPITPTRETVDLQNQQQQQQAYLDSVNQLQLLKVKRDIAETNQAIASARLATETANKNMSDLLTQPAVLPQPGGGYTEKTTAISTQNSSQASGSIQQIKAQILDIPFTVVSVSMQYNHWNAVLSYQDKLYSVSIGDRLFDGSRVISISKNGVTLVKDGNRRKISIQTTI